MDPSIMKLLEEDDDDDSLHAMADVDALSAALIRDIAGNAGGALTQGTTSASKQILEHWQSSSQDENEVQQTQQLEKNWQLQSFGQNLSNDNSGVMEPMLETQPEQVVTQPENKQTKKMEQEESHSDPWQHQNVADPFQFHFSEKEQYKMSEKITVQDSNSILKSKLVTDNHPEGQQQQQIEHRLSGQLAGSSNQGNIGMNKDKAAPSIPFHMLIPILRPHLDQDRSMQLDAVFTKLRNNEVSKEDFLRVIKNIVGDQMLRQAAHKVQTQLHSQATRIVKSNTNQFALDAQGSSQQITERQRFQLLQSVPSHGLRGAQPPTTGQTVEMQSDSSNSSFELSGPKTIEIENRPEGRAIRPAQHYPANTNINMVNAERDSSVIPLHTVNKQHQLPQSFFSTYGNTSGNFNAQAFQRPSLSSSSSVRPHTPQGGTPLRPTQSMNIMNVQRYGPQNIGNETNRLHNSSLISRSTSHHNASSWQPSTNKDQRSSGFPSTTYVKQEVVDQSSNPLVKSQTMAPEGSSSGAAQVAGSAAMQGDQSGQISSANPIHIGANIKTPPKKPLVGQKKPFEELGSSPPACNKKQKTSGTTLDQSIEQLNDVTAVSGVDLREEEEQLLSAPKEDSRALEATRRFVQEEEDRLLLQKVPLQKKLEKIMLKCGLKNMSNDVLRCLSLCVEERLRGLITHLVRISKQRIDIEKTRHRFVITSDVRRQILSVNQKAKEEWDKKQAEKAEKLCKPDETEANQGSDADKDKDKEESRSKNVKVNKDVDDKMRATAANVAARAAVGGDDMLSKWQLMAEQARQKREGVDGASGNSGKKSSKSASRREQEFEKRGQSGGTRKFNKNNQGEVPLPKISCSISVKDVINAVEREPQTSKSTLIARLYERQPGDSLAE